MPAWGIAQPARTSFLPACVRRRLRRTDILGERAEAAAAHVAVDLVTRLERGDVSATASTRPATSQPRICTLGLRRPPSNRFSGDPAASPVPIVDGRCEHSHQDLIGFGRGPGYIPQLQDVGVPYLSLTNAFMLPTELAATRGGQV